MDPGDMPKNLLVFGLKISEIFKKEDETVVSAVLMQQERRLREGWCPINHDWDTAEAESAVCLTPRTQTKDSESMYKLFKLTITLKGHYFRENVFYEHINWTI